MNANIVIALVKIASFFGIKPVLGVPTPVRYGETYPVMLAGMIIDEITIEKTLCSTDAPWVTAKSGSKISIYNIDIDAQVKKHTPKWIINVVEPDDHTTAVMVYDRDGDENNVAERILINRNGIAAKFGGDYKAFGEKITQMCERIYAEKLK